MSLSIQELKQIRDNIISEYGLSMGDASRVVGFYNVGTHADHDILNNMLLGDLSSVPAALSALGISSAVQASADDRQTETKPSADLAEKKEEKTAKTSAEKRSKSPVKNTRQTAGNNNDLQAPVSPLSSSLGASDTSNNDLPLKDIKDHTKQNTAFQDIKQHDDILPRADAEIVADNIDELPEGFADQVRQWLEDWATFEKIDLTRLHAQQWRALCMYAGTKIKQSHVLDDVERIKARGGRFYKPQKLEALLTLWAYFCGKYKQVPLVFDFVSFSGVSRSYFYDYEGKGLSSTSVHIMQKAKQIEESGLGSSVAGGGAGTVGGIFLLKARHGYSETVTVNHVSASPSVGLSELPKLDIKTDLG